jgi:hypothetical protein
LLFASNNFAEMAVYAPCDFSAINNYPHALPEKAIEKLPSFQGNNAISAKIHVKSFMRCINKWCAAHDYEDVKMKLFVLSLEDDASDWYEDVDRSFSTEVNSHIIKIIYVEDNRVLLGVFKHQHLFSCKRDLRTPARVAL